MSRRISYQHLLADTITDCVVHKKRSVNTRMTSVFESMMQADRQVLLHASPNNKANGYSARFVKHFQGK